LTKTFQDITHPDDLDSDLNYVSQLLAGQIESYQMEKRYIRKDGQTVHIMWSARWSEADQVRVAVARDRALARWRETAWMCNGQVPGPTLRVRLGETLRVGMRAAAVAFGQHLKYQGLGTVEFLVDAARSEFWFLEVNTRIQVEHPVTEAVTGLDLVAEQIAVAEGRRLGLSQASVRLDGHAIECRINAEDPAAGFRPSPGRVTTAVFPAGPGIRVDTHIQAGSAVPPQYDSLLAKLVVSGANRAEALGRLRGALARCEIGGVATTLPVHAALAADDEFAAGGVGTDYLARWLELETRPVRDKNG
jgi:acetyl-CoA carboxylase biotin carboxylase subunit